ncbi:MAG: aspartate carbamoyltransferase regulatory subunit [Bacteroidaceae bacterium]|nr:aspartate carbamoyltransferase regulatory subunit [Bacteroidaceae bacterium]MCR4768601.1 aspartate carbamoyltransferase regulatory subunit [Bacteroidaceae bacterium]
MKNKDLQVAALKEGSVIDHIPVDKLFTLVQMLQLDKCTEPVTIGNNLESKKFNKKGIIKVSGKFFTDEELSRLAVVCPNMKLTVIRDYEVVEKRQISLPEVLTDVVKCTNPVCITNNEPMHTIFNVEANKQIVKCHYCGKTQVIGNIKLK